MLNLHCDDQRRRDTGRDRKNLGDHEQGGNVAVGGNGNLAR